MSKRKPKPAKLPSVKGVVKDITSGTKEIIRQGGAAGRAIKSGFEKIKKATR